MKIGIIILSRYSSSRLPGKALKLINGRSLIGHIIDRLKLISNNYQIVVATSSDVTDDNIEKFCNYSKINCFRGSLNDVASRFLSCAEYYNLDYAVRINGDNFFTPWDVISEMIAITKTGKYDFITNQLNKTFPPGMTVEIVKTKFYSRHIKKFNDYDREHVTSWFYNNNKGNIYNHYNESLVNIKGIDLAVDTIEDLNFIKKIISSMDKYPSNYKFKEVLIHANKIGKIDDNWRGKNGPLLIAEIGGNHEGDFEKAKELTIKAISTGVDFIKFQLYKGDTLVSSIENKDRNKHFKRFELTRSQHIQLAQMCLDADIGYMASVWDLSMFKWINKYLKIIKIGSGDLTAWPLIKEFAKTGKPIILSVGLSTLDEILQTVSFIQSNNENYYDPKNLCLLQCTSMYPIELSEANLNVMKTLESSTNLSVGYSDHTIGTKALEIAASMGAKVLEFHFTDKREGKEFRDHKVSLTPDEVLSLKESLREIASLKGDFEKVPLKVEIDEGHVISFRRGAYLNKDINKGEIIEKNSISFLRPNKGVDSRDAEILIGKEALIDLKKNKKIIHGKHFK